MPITPYDRVFSFGGYTYGTRIKMLSDSPVFKSGMTPSAGYNGSSHGRTLLPERRLELSGTILAESQEALRNARDVFMTYHQQGVPQKLILGNNRYLWAALDGPVAFSDNGKRQWSWECQMVCGDPFHYHVDEKSANLSFASDSDVTTVISGAAVGGNTYAAPWMTFGINSIITPGTSYIEVANTSAYLLGDEINAQKFRFYPPAIGNYYVYFGPNCTDDGAANRKYRHKIRHETLGVGVGKWRRDGCEISLISSAANSIRVGLSGVVLGTGPSLKWRERYV